MLDVAAVIGPSIRDDRLAFSPGQTTMNSRIPALRCSLSGESSRSSRIISPYFLLVLLGVLIGASGAALAASLTEMAELLAHPEQYDHQVVTVSGQVTNIQLATNREGNPAYGFLLKSEGGTLKVVALGKSHVRDGDYVIVEGVFTRLRQVGRTVVYNEIRAKSVQSMSSLNPDLIG